MTTPDIPPFDGKNPHDVPENPYQTPASPYGAGNPANQGSPYAHPQQGGYPQPSGQYYGPNAGNQAPYGYAPVISPEAKSKAEYSMVFGLIGLFFLSLVFGILAIVYAKKAEEMGADARVGKILGWVDIAIGAVGTLWVLFSVLIFFGGSGGY